MKACAKCKQNKPLTEFYRDKRTKDKRCYTCIKCWKKNRKAWHKKRKEEFNGLYVIWGSMNQRCFSHNHKYFKYYGGRGITVCEEWKYNFFAFYNWAKDKHKKGLEIDRIDNDGGYYPENCRFVTTSENSRGRLTTKLNAEKVRRIKKLLREGKISQRKIAQLFKVGRTTISDIHINKRWRDICPIPK